jgi:hypothetical protein
LRCRGLGNARETFANESSSADKLVMTVERARLSGFNLRATVAARDAAFV